MSRKLTFGYLYDFRNPALCQKSWTELYAERLDEIAWSESAGFSGAWVPEHHGAQDGYMPSPLVVLGAIAARTRRIAIGSAVALAPLYHPLRFAEDCAVLDILSNGRLEIGLAIGYRRREADALGVDFTKRGQRFDEFLQIVRRLWAGETVSHSGKHFTLHEAALTPLPTRSRIPLFIGGFADKALERVSRFGDGYFGNEDVCDRYLSKLRALGKDPQFARVRIQELFLVVARDPAAAMNELAPYYHYVSNTYGEWIAEDRASGLTEHALRPMDLDSFRQSGILQVLSPDQAIERFRAMQSRIPVEHVMMMRPPGLPKDRFLDYAEIFASDVMPAFA